MASDVTSAMKPLGQILIDAEALRADFIIVSHRHPDHFDVPIVRPRRHPQGALSERERSAQNRAHRPNGVDGA